MASKKVESTDSFTIMQHAVNRILDILNSVDVFPNASAEENGKIIYIKDKVCEILEHSAVVLAENEYGAKMVLKETLREYKNELATLRSRVSSLEAENATLQRQLQTRKDTASPQSDMTSGSDSSKITEMERVYKAQFCIQCEKRMRDVVFPCGHYNCCKQCADEMKECPSCFMDLSEKCEFKGCLDIMY